MISWPVFSKIVETSFQALVKHFEAKMDAQARQLEIQKIIDAVYDAANQIISTIVALRLAELKGQMEGYADTYRAYSPNETLGNERLRSLIDDSAGTIGELGQLIDLLPEQHDLAFDAYGPYISLLHLRAQAMVERERAFGEPEIADIGWSFENGVARAEALLGRLKYENDLLFMPPVREVYGVERSTWRYVYTKAQQRVIVCSSDPNPAACTLDVVVNKFNADKDRTYWQNETVKAIDKSQHELCSFLEDTRPKTQSILTIRGLLRQPYPSLATVRRTQPRWLT